MKKMPPLNRIAPENVDHYKRTMAAIMAFGEHAAPEVFKWLTWSIAIAAIQVVAIKTETWWLKLVSVALFSLVLARIQWRLSKPAPEKIEPDGALTFKFSRWSVVFGLLAWGLAWLVAFRLPQLIAQSDLLPK